uniref:ATP synthase F0 subunit 6 n=1 Tax=Streptosyllis sp. THS1 TaxID=1898410 RepID=A0A1C9UZA7_9ANNE|nr:ATP synthase F0 subunit 6 [Streptosyllis sp. THS1]
MPHLSPFNWILMPPFFFLMFIAFSSVIFFMKFYKILNLDFKSMKFMNNWNW